MASVGQYLEYWSLDPFYNSLTETTKIQVGASMVGIVWCLQTGEGQGQAKGGLINCTLVHLNKVAVIIC